MREGKKAKGKNMTGEVSINSLGKGACQEKPLIIAKNIYVNSERNGNLMRMAKGTAVFTGDARLQLPSLGFFPLASGLLQRKYL